MKTLTNNDMLTAARRRLSQHLATRPATEAERAAIQAQHLADAAQCDAASQRVYQPRTAAEVGRGAGAIAERHQDGIAVAQSLQAALYARRNADLCRMRAAAWATPAIELWEATRVELQARVDYYASR
jgi:hypothetical protein